MEQEVEMEWQFRERLTRPHEGGRFKDPRGGCLGEVAVDREWQVCVLTAADPVVKQAAADLVDYLRESMGLRVALALAADSLVARERVICIGKGADFAEGLRPASEKSGAYRVRVQKGSVTISGADERGAAQGCFYLEDVMNLRQAPCLPCEDATRVPVFDTRMTHSGYIGQVFPDGYLACLAHAGFTDVVVMLRDAETGYLRVPIDVADIARRASRWGLGVYVYAEMDCPFYPSTKEARTHCESTYGRVFERWPEVKGILALPEAVRLPGSSGSGLNPGGPGAYPTEGYPEFVTLLRDVVHERSPEAEVIFWTYNFGHWPKEKRQEMIRNFPDGATLMCSFVNYSPVERDGVNATVVDYSITVPGPSPVFLEEAEAARRRGLRLYTMSDTVGRTFESLIPPYIPAMGQWVSRCQALTSAADEFGLSGLLESHRQGYVPNLVGEVVKALTCRPSPNPELLLDALARREFGSGAPLARRAWCIFDEAIRLYPFYIETAYTLNCAGPAYPLVLQREPDPRTAPVYIPDAFVDFETWRTVGVPCWQERVDVEIKYTRLVAERWAEGLEALRQAVEGARDQRTARRQLGIAEAVMSSMSTAANVLEWEKCKRALPKIESGSERGELLERMRVIATEDLENVRRVLPYFEADSSLGADAENYYFCSPALLRAKIAHLEDLLAKELNL